MPKRMFQHLLSLGIDLVFPPRCPGCGRVDTLWCQSCQNQLQQTPYPRQVPPLQPMAGIISTGVHDGIIREAVQALKYENARILARVLGERLVNQFLAQTWTVDIIVPVPLHTGRLAQRGYNQAQLLADFVAQETTLPCLPTAVSRQRNTHSQVTLNAAQRQTNVKDAFHASPEHLAGQTILLIDDVYTTGATLAACADAILQAGAQAVYGLTVTIARL